MASSVSPSTSFPACTVFVFSNSSVGRCFHATGFSRRTKTTKIPPTEADRNYERFQPFNQVRVIEKIDGLATEVLRRFASSKGTASLTALPILWFGANNPSPSYAADVNTDVIVRMYPLCYVATLQTDRYGRSVIRAERIPCSKYEYLEGWKSGRGWVELA